MKKTLLLFALSICVVHIQAQRTYSNQEFVVKFGFPYEIPKGYIDLGYFGDVEAGFVQLSYKVKKDIAIQVFDKNLKVTKVNNIDITMFPPDFTNEGFFNMGKKYYWCFSTFEKKEEKESFYVQELDISAGKLVGQARTLIQNNRLEGDLASTGFYQFALLNKYRIDISYDRSKMLITYRPHHKLKDDKVNKEEVGFSVVDQDLNVISNKIITMPYVEEKMDNDDYTVDSKGNAYLVAKVYNDKRKEKKDDLPNYYYEVFRIKSGTAELNQIKIQLETYFIPSLFITELSNKDIMVGGFYSNEVNSGSSDGVFLAKIDEAGTASSFGKGYYEFPVEVLKQFLSERQQKRLEKKDEKGDVEVKYLTMRKIVSTINGGIQVVGEVHYVVTHRDSKGNTYHTYYYEDILALSLDGTGNIDWIKKIPKRQKGGDGNIFTGIKTSTRGSMSFQYYYDGENTYFFFTDNIKNIHLPLDKEPAYHVDGAGGYLVYAKIDGKGILSKGDLFDYKEEQIKFEPAEFQELGSNALVNRAFKGRMSRVVMLNKK